MHFYVLAKSRLLDALEGQLPFNCNDMTEKENGTYNRVIGRIAEPRAGGPLGNECRGGGAAAPQTVTKECGKIISG